MKISIPDVLWLVPRLRAMVSTCLMFIYEDKKTKFIPNTLFLSIWNDCYDFILAYVTKCVPLFGGESPLEVIWV